MILEMRVAEGSLNTADVLKEAIEAKGLTQRKFAKSIGSSPQNFNQRLNKNSFTADEWVRMLGTLGYEVRIIELESGIEFEARKKGHGRRVKQVVNGVLYDTFKADAICNDFYQDGEHEFKDGMAFELYVDSEGRFFVARYVEWENGTDSITTIGKHEAVNLYRKFGDGSLPEAAFS